MVKKKRALLWAVGSLLPCAVAALALGQAHDAATAPIVDARKIPPDRGAAQAWLALKQLHTRASLLMIVAHPDDEDGAMLAYESRGQGVRTDLLTLNRGEGGANVMSGDLWDALGLVRSEELLQAGRYYGLDGQYFTTLADYGFSKSLEEAIEWVKRAPNCCPGGEGEVEVRQVFEMEDFAPVLTEEQIQHKVSARAKLPNQTANK